MEDDLGTHNAKGGINLRALSDVYLVVVDRGDTIVSGGSCHVEYGYLHCRLQLAQLLNELMAQRATTADNNGGRDIGHDWSEELQLLSLQKCEAERVEGGN